MDLSNSRSDYNDPGLHEQDLDAQPHVQLQQWLEQAIASSPGEWFEPTAATLATGAADGDVSARVVLIKGVDADGLLFFTSYSSDKARDLAENPRAAICFYWGQLGRQVRISGFVEKTDRPTSANYFARRPRGSQLGAVASDQSRVVTSREQLEQALADADKEFANREVEVPDDWGGYRLVPTTYEFWQGRANRLHDRLRYRRDADQWVVERLGP